MLCEAEIVRRRVDFPAPFGPSRHVRLPPFRLKSRLDCTAVFCYNDKLAFLLENLLKEEGLGIPGDISLISVDDSELAELSDTRLTSVHHPADRLGEKAAENLLALMKNRSFDATCEFEAEIVERDSVKRLF